jgi:hypothetical protein
MIHFYLRVALIPCVIFIVVLLFIRAQLYDDQQLRQALPPAGCTAPCFMDIHPGMTTSKEAMTLLKVHAWVAKVVTINADNPYQIWWTWSKNAPDFLKSVPINPTFPVNGEILSPDEVVSSILFTPHLTLGDIVLAKGLPPMSQLIFGGIILRPSQSVPAIISFEYPADGFWASATLQCPYTSNLWNAPARLTITNDFNGMSLGTVRAIDRKTFLNSIHRTSNLMCGL